MFLFELIFDSPNISSIEQCHSVEFQIVAYLRQPNAAIP